MKEVGVNRAAIIMVGRQRAVGIKLKTQGVDRHGPEGHCVCVCVCGWFLLALPYIYPKTQIAERGVGRKIRNCVQKEPTKLTGADLLFISSGTTYVPQAVGRTRASEGVNRIMPDMKVASCVT